MEEQESKALNESIRLGNLLESLNKNKAFKELILECFISQGIEGTLAAMPYASTDEQRRRHYSNLEAIAKLKSFLNTVAGKAKAAQECLNSGTSDSIDEYEGVE